MITSARGLSLQVVFAALLFAALIAFVSLFASRESAQAASFNPKGSFCLDNHATVDPDVYNPGNEGECDGDSSPGAKSDITSTFGIEAPDANFAAVVNFTPPGWTVASDADVTDGAIVARLFSQAVLGFLNNACNTLLNVSFDLMDATTNQSQTVIFNNEEGDSNTDGEQFELVNGLPQGVTKYPDYLTRVLVDHVDGGHALPLRARLYGQTVVSATNVSLNFAIFEPGVTVRDVTLDPALGYPSATVLQTGPDPNIQPAPAPITDFCSPLRTSTTTYGLSQDNPKTPGSEAGATFRANPSAAGDYGFVTFTAGLRDADNDGFENSLDSCPFIPNPGWDPRSLAYTGDKDKDGLPDNCDPLPDDRANPAGHGGINDHDGDGYENRQDNCPLDKNSLGIAFINAGGPDNQRDSDLDGIGDACDIAGAGGIGKGPTVPDGELKTVCVTGVIKIGSGGPGADPNVTQRVPCGTGPPPATPAPSGPTPAPTPFGQTPPPGGGTQGGTGVSGPVTGIGSLAPIASSVPAWAAIMAALGAAGVIVSLGALAPRLLRRRRRQ